MTWILTHTGRRFDLVNPDPEAVSPQDIAVSLSRLCRFNGHTSRFYSVAQHSLHAASIVPAEFQLVALLHDATEAYVGDMVSPLKQLIPAYRHIEQGIWRAICIRFDLEEEVPMAVHYADRIMLATERRDLLPEHQDDWALLNGINPLNETIPYMTSELVYSRYLALLLELLNNAHRAKTAGGAA